MEIISEDEILEFDYVHTDVFKLRFEEKLSNLKEMVAVDFSSIQELKNQNKELLDLAFEAELSENT